MTNLVNKSEIEAIVGAPRHNSAHFARAVSEEETVYILHSQWCLDSTPDLRYCAYSLALDNGIDIDEWIFDTAVHVTIHDNRLVPIIL